MKHFDKNNNEIKAGMMIKHKDGDIEKVYQGDSDLGLNAGNEKHPSFHELNRKLYPLTEFDLSEWEIMD